MKYFDESLRDPNEIKAQYRKMAFKLHPDVGGTKEEFQALQNEYERMIVLSEREYIKAPSFFNDPENGFDWEIDIQFIYNKNGERLTEYKAIYNNKSGELLNVAKATYTPTENETFTEMVYFLRDLIGGEIQHFTSLNGGRKVLAHIKEKNPTRIGSHDYSKYLIVGNAHDYSSSFFVGSTDVMLRCENQFTAFNKELKSSHTTGHKFQLGQIKRFMSQYSDLSRNIGEDLLKFERRRITVDEKSELIRRILDISPSVEIKDLSPRKLGLLDDLNTAIIRETKALGQNALGLFQGVTYYTTHVQKQKEKVFGNVFGSTADNNTKAYQFCRKLIYS